MKKHTDRILLAVLLLSLALCAAAWFFDIRLLLFLPAVPAFCLQLLLCRLGRWKWLRAVPALLVAAMAVLGVYYGQQPGLGVSLFGVILLLTAISPAVGCILGWGVWGAQRLRAGRGGTSA